jgi:hypothetical protein
LQVKNKVSIEKFYLRINIKRPCRFETLCLISIFKDTEAQRSTLKQLVRPSDLKNSAPGPENLAVAVVEGAGVERSTIKKESRLSERSPLKKT